MWPGKIVGACDYSTRSRNDLTLDADEPMRGHVTPSIQDRQLTGEMKRLGAAVGSR